MIATVAHAGSSSSAAISEAWVSAASSASGAAPSPATRPAPIVPPDLEPVAVATPAGGLEAHADPAASPSPDAAASPSPSADASNLVDTPADLNSNPPSTAVIPPVVPGAPTTALSPDDPLATAPAVSTGPDNKPAPAFSTGPDNNQSEIARYEAEQSGYANPQQLQNLSQYMSQDSVTSPIGFELREARRKLSNGEEADGLLIVDVKKGSAAADAGLRGYARGAHNVLTGAAIVGSMFFPPAILLVPAIDYTQIGESYDMIIGVDGSRVANFLDFEDRTRDLRPGELIYLSIVRNGRRMQIAIPVPPDIASISY